MRKLTYGALFILVGASVLAEALSRIALWMGLGVGLAGTPLVWFWNPVPTALLATFFPMALVLWTPVIQLGLLAIMFGVVVRRLIFVIRAGVLKPPHSFSVPMCVLALIGFGLLAIAIGLLIFAGLSRQGIMLGWMSVPVFGIAMSLLPIALLITEILSFRKRGSVRQVHERPLATPSDS